MSQFYPAIFKKAKGFLFVLSFLLLPGFMLFGQNVNMSNTTINGQCSGTYYDPGGTSNYGNKSNYTQTFIPSAGNRMSFNFTSFNTENNYDFLYIYNGPNDTYPLIGKYTNTTGPGLVSSTANDGSLTFKFTSDNSTVKSGWIATYSCIPVAYRDQWISMNTGDANWCAGETRTISVTVKNIGTTAWTDGGGNDFNIGVKWNAEGDYYVRTDVANLAPGATKTFNLDVTAPTTTGTNNLTFDIVWENKSWFGNNGAGTGPGNVVYKSTNLTINALPGTPSASTTQTFCNSATVDDLTTTAGSNIKWYAASTGGTALAASTALVHNTHYYASQTNASGCESSGRRDVTVTINTPATPTGNTTQSFCAISSPKVSNLVATGNTVKWYTTATGGTALTTTTALASGHYFASQTISGCESATRLDVTVTVDDPAAPTGTATQDFCFIYAPKVADLSATGTAIKWYTVATGGTALATTTALSTTTYYASQTTGGCESSTRFAVAVTVGNPAAPTGSAQTFCASDNPTVANLTATGTSIQWYDAATGGNLLTNGTPLVHNTRYYASQTIDGCESATRLNILVTVNAAVVIGTQPNPSQTKCVSSSVTFTVVATNGAGYQWYYGATPLTDDGNITGSQTATLKILETVQGDAGLYHVVVTGKTACGDATSDNAELSINENLLITDQPVAQTLCVGSNATFTVVSGGSSLTYRWRKGSAFIDAMANPSAETSVLTIPNITTADAGSYSVLVSDGAGLGCTERYSSGAALTVNATSVGGTVNGSLEKCSGTNSGSLTLAGKVGTVDNWEYSSDGSSWTAFSPVNTTTTQVYSNLTQTTYYRAIVHNGVCDAVVSSVGTITVNPIPNAVASVTDQTICSGSAISTINISGDVAGTNFNWTRTPTTGITGIATPGSGDISGSLTNTTANPITVTFTITPVTPTTPACTGSAITATVLVNPTPVAVVTPVTQTICSGGSITSINSTSTTTGTTFAWTRDNTTDVTGIDASGTGNITGTLTNTTSAQITVTFTIIPKANNCDGAPETVTVLVNPSPTITPAATAANVCFKTTAQTTTLAYSSTTANPNRYSISWNAAPANTFAAVNNATLPAGQITIAVPANTAAGTYTGTIRVTTAVNCVSTTGRDFTITVNPAPAASAGMDIVSCLAAIPMTGATTSGTYGTVTWSGQGSLGAFSGTGTNPATYIFTPSVPQGSFTATLTVSGSSVCNGINATSTRKISWGSTGSWLGTVSTDWFDANNWCGGVPTATSDVTIPAVGSVPYQPAIGGAGAAVCRNITLNGTLSTTNTNNLDVYGDWINNGVFTNNTGSVTFRGGAGNTMSGIATTTFYNLVVNKTATANTITSTSKAFTATNNLTVTQGNLILQATDANYTVSNNITVATNGILTHSVNWDVAPPAIARLLSVGGNIAIDGIFNYTIRSHVQMTGSGKTVYTGTQTGSAFSILTLASAGNIASSGPLTISDNFWAMFGTAGSFSTGANIVNANAGLLMNNGTVNLNGGTLNVSGGIYVGNGAPATFNFTSGTLNADGVTVGTSDLNYGRFNHTGGIANIGNLIISYTDRTSNNTIYDSRYTVTTGASSIINITGGWTNNGRYANNAFTAGNSQVNFIGTSPQEIVGGTQTTFNNLNINNAEGVTLGINTNVDGILNFTNGMVNTGANVITSGAAGNITGYDASRYVNGRLARIFGSNGPGSRIFPTGKGGNYRPLTFAYAALSSQPSTVTVEQIEAAIPGALPANTTLFTARHWTISQDGGTNMNYKVTLDPTGYTPTGSFVKILKKEGTGVITSHDATAPNYTNVSGFTTFDGTNNGTNSFALAHDCSSSAGAGPAIDDFCQGGSTPGLGGSISGTATGGTWSSSVGGTFSPSATDLNAIWTPPTNFYGTATLTLTPNGLCAPNTKATKTVKVIQGPSGTLTLTENSGNPPVNNGIICLGGTVTFTATAGFGSYEFRVNGTITRAATLVNTWSTNTLVDGDIVTVNVSNSNNCGTTFNPLTITVIPIPTATLVATENSGIPNNNIICEGENVTFTATGGTNYTFKINGSAITTNTTGIYSSTTLITGDVVTVDVTNANNCTATSAPITITVNAIPAGTLTASSGNICVGENVTFTATGGTSYQFLVDGTIAQPFSNAATFSTTTLTDGQIVTVQVSNAAGCIVTYSPGVAVNVNPLPAGTLTATENSGVLNDNSICANAPVTFTFSATGYSTYEFFINNDSKQTSGSNSFTTTALAAGDIVKVKVTSGSSCSATFTGPAIIIAASPVANLTISPSNQICAGDEVIFTADPGTGNTYNFKIGTNSVQNGNGNTYTTSSLANGDVVTVEVTNTNSCITTSNAITMVVNPLPTGTLVPVENAGTPNDGIICTGTSVVFTAPAGFTNYNFILNGVSKQSTASRTYTNSTLATGDKVVVALTNAGGCIGLSNEVTITVNLLPTVAPITGPFSVCLTKTTTLSNATPGGVWSSLNPGIATIDAGGIVTGVAAGTATIHYTFTNTNGCTNYVSEVFTVNVPPVVDQITGNLNICKGYSAQLSSNTASGSWSSGNEAIATVDGSGVVTGVTTGTATISYSVTDGNGCTTIVNAQVSITELPAVAPITTTRPSFDVCIGGTLPLKNATASGVWISSDITKATVSSAGVVTGLESGQVEITYSITTSCGQNATTTQMVNVNAAPSATISYGASPYCTDGGLITVTTQTGTTGGTYSISGGLTIDAATGTITPKSVGGTYTVTYTVAASGGCSIYSTTASVTITTAPSATIAYAGPYCTSSAAITPTRTGTAGGTYSSTTGLSIAANGTITPSTSTAGTYTVTYTVAAANGCGQFTTNATVTITAAPSGTISYAGSPLCTTAAPVSVSGTATPGGTYSYTGAGTLAINTSTGTITPASSTGGTYNVIYTIIGSGGCATFTTQTSVTITAAPTAVAGSAPVLTCANSGAVNITAGSSATNYSSVVWSGNGTFTNANSLTTATYTPTAAEITAGTATITLTANGNGSCGAATSTKTITISPPPAAFNVTPGDTTICLGSVIPLSASIGVPIPGSKTATGSGFNIPDAGIFGGNGNRTNTALVSGVPATSTITGISVTFGINHNYTRDLTVNLKAPNGKVLNLIYKKGGSGNNINVVINSSSVSPVSGSNPISGTFKPDAVSNVGGPDASNSLDFSELLDVPNGNWTFEVEDDEYHFFDGTGSVTSWSVTINYFLSPDPVNVVWSPISNLFLNPSATIPYTGSVESTVYAKPVSAGTINYLATRTDGNQCSVSKNVSIIVNPKPVVSISAEYCSDRAGYVKLTATSSGATGYIWSTGETTQSIYVNVSDRYDVTAFAGTVCPGTAFINIAQELVKNGNFELGDKDFSSAYSPVSPTLQNGMYPAATYTVNDKPNFNHDNFWGNDHTSGQGKFMIINGAAGQANVWTQKLNVLPNTKYYLSAWAMALNKDGNNATLQFEVDGILLPPGSITVVNHERSNDPQYDNWKQFYGTWTSGLTQTIATVSIRDLTTAGGGNDFGLDDISFATLSTFITLESAPGSDAQTVCVNSPIAPIVYNVGNGSLTGPIVSTLPHGVSSVFAGDKLTITGTPDIPGDYTYTITTTGCSTPFSVTGTIKVQEQKITLSSGSATQSLCINTPVSIGYTLSGTADNATITGLTGATTSLTGNVFTINWTPTVAGSYPFTVVTSGTGCTPVTVTGTITVTQQTILLSSAAATNGQTVCINSPITTIKYTVAGTGTGANIVWTPNLPAGITSSYASGIFQVTGTPTQSGTFSYVVTTSGNCAGVTASGTLTVTPDASMNLTSGAGSDNVTTCNNVAIIPITYAINDATGASITSGAFPAGVIGAFSAGVYTISGTPTVGGTFSYTIKTSGGCATASMSGIITVTAQTIALSSGTASPSVCANVPIPTNIVYTISGAANGASVSGLPNNMTGVLSGNIFKISGTPTDPPGTYNYTVTTSGPLCTPTSLTGTITISAPAVGGTLTSISICSGSGGTLTLTGNSNNPKRWEYSDNGGTTWVPVANTTISLTYPALTSGRQYKAIVGNNCGDVPSSVAMVGIHNLWTGATSTDWNTASNWSDNLLPSTRCPLVYIPNTVNQPVLSNLPVATITSLQISSGASLTLNAAGTLQIAGTITNAGIFDARNGAIEFNGTSLQTIGITFKDSAINDLIISNNTGVTLGKPVNVYRSLTFGSANARINTKDTLTLKSNINNTAWIGQMTSSHIINGDVTVERFINTGTGPIYQTATSHRKSWHLLSVPTNGSQTINQAWQEGATATNVGSTPGTAGDPKPGYGTMIVSNAGGAGGAVGLGFDQYTAPGPSIKAWDPTSENYFGPPNTLNSPIYNIKGYLVLVRGDRSVYTYDADAKPTTLRSKGTLFTPANPPPSSSVPAGLFASVGNPYASAIDLTKVTVNGGLATSFIVWDPRAQGAYSLGAFTTLTKIGNDFYAIPTSTSYPSSTTTYNTIESGQAFFIQATGSSGSISFPESAKVSGSNPELLRGQGGPGRQSQLRTNLYVGTGSNMTLADGNLIQYNVSYSNTLDGLDARKLTNTSENLGLRSNGKLLSVERRAPIVETDTVFYTISGMRVQPYKFEFIASDLSEFGVEGIIEDKYLGTKTPLKMEGTTEYNFTIVNIPGSYAPDRFRIVFKAAAGPLPVTFVSVKAAQQEDDITVDWKVENEHNLKAYEVEKSLDGVRFIKTSLVPAGNNGVGAYTWLDKDVTAGWNYYRIKSIDVDGKVSYSEVVKVQVEMIAPLITVYPNPIVNGVINVHLVNQPAGNYKLRLLNALGQTMVAKQITREKGTSIEPLTWDYKLARGNYRIEVTKPDGGVKLITVIY